nr:MAG TPA: repressor protein [Caudoviricetes sp.]
MFGDKLKRLREANNLSQQQLAEKLGMSPSGIGMWEQNRRQPDNETLKKIAQLFDVTTDYLLGNDVNPSDKNKCLLETISADLSDPINRVLYKKTSELKNEKDKQIVLSVIQGLIHGVDEEYDKHEQ